MKIKSKSRSKRRSSKVRGAKVRVARVVGVARIGIISKASPGMNRHSDMSTNNYPGSVCSSSEQITPMDHTSPENV